MPLLVTETDFQATVVEYAQAKGWLVAHFRPGMTGRVDRHGKPIWVTPVQADGKGFPDLVCVRGARICFIEVKSEEGRVSKAQQKWLEALEASGAETFVWHPADWHIIVKVLE